MFRDKKIMIAIIIVLLICIAGLGIAFAAFSQTLTIGGAAEVESSSWSVVFEGLTNPNTIDAPVLTGSASEVTHPTIKNNSTEISTYEVTLKTPGDSVTYNFKIHNKGDYAATITSVTKADGVNLTTDTERQSTDNFALRTTRYDLEYTYNNRPVGSGDKMDCLEPGEEVNVSLRLTFSSTNQTSPSVLPKTDLVLDNLGVSILYNQHANGHCAYKGGPREQVSDITFDNFDSAYYTYEGKSFMGTGVNNIIISENIIGKSQHDTIECSDGSALGGPGYAPTCSNGATVIFTGTPAQDMAETYCTGCRLMTVSELETWGGCTPNSFCYNPSKLIAKYNGSADDWWLADYYNTSHNSARFVEKQGYSSGGLGIRSSIGVRPVVEISSSATITGSGTQLDPYVITP